MMISEHFQDLLQTEMDRREFLAYLGATLLAVVGISGLLRSLTNPTLLRPSWPGQAPSSNGYGGGTYGGGR